MTEFTTENKLPSALEYCDLRKACGLSPRTIAAAELALPRTLFGIFIRNAKKELIGMGRVVGDLGSHVQIVDITVHPSVQKRGLSKTILDELMAFIKKEVPDCAFVNLFADVDYLYQKYGFEYAVSKGMSLKR